MAELIAFVGLLLLFTVPAFIASMLSKGNNKALPRIPSIGHYQCPSVKKYPLF